MGKAKYLNIRKANKKALHEGFKITNYVSYKELSSYMNKIDIDTVINIDPAFTYDLEDSEKGQGMFRPLDSYVPRLAKFYLSVNEKRFDKLKEFPFFEKKDQESFCFVMALGGDGAPQTGTVFLVSFLNVGNRITNSSENYMTFGGNVPEDSKVSRRYILKTIADVKYLESKVFEIDVGKNDIKKVEFRLGELPNDMKMLYFLAGELNNAANYFSTFANVSKRDCNNYKKCIGNEKNDWKPFPYEKRVQDAKQVAKKQKEISCRKLAESTKRSYLTKFISEELKSRQVEVPLVSEYVNRAKSEPLHLKNNTVKELFLKLMKISYSQSTLTSKKFKELPLDCLFVMFVAFVKKEMGCNALAKVLITWYNENNGKVETEFTFRFRGAESRRYCTHFPSLIKTILQHVSNRQVKLQCHQYYYQSILLRKIVSYCARVTDFNSDTLLDMERDCKRLFQCCCLYDQRLTPSMWTICNAAYVHAKETLSRYCFGLGCNSMEGREQKHQKVKKYQDNTTVQSRWPMIFRHEFVQLIYLRENGFDNIRYRKRGIKYIPDVDETCCSNCCAPFCDAEGQCEICDSMFMKEAMKIASN